MNPRKLWSRIFITGGTIGMLLGALDPLEGSLVILPGCGLVTLGIFFSNSGRALLIDWLRIFALITFGVAALWGLSNVGGFGGDSGPSRWWGMLILPYPIGWVIGLTSLLFRLVKSVRHRHAVA